MIKRKQKIKVGIIFGGKSAEHEVSLQSAKNIIAAIDRKKYDIVTIGIDKSGSWFLNDSAKFLLNSEDPKLIKLNKGNSRSLALIPGGVERQILSSTGENIRGRVDVVFPVLHGTFGEDGTVQGLLKLMDIPFVGPSVLGSAVGMDKDVQKRLLRDSGILVADFLTFEKGSKIDFKAVSKKLGLPIFIKPANLGSSVGISKINNKKEFHEAIEYAFKYDNKILAEEFVVGRELECSVMGNDNPVASLPGEVIVGNHKFYSYDAKYIDEKGASLIIPAKLSKSLTKKIQEVAIKTFKVLCLEGMTRVDFFLREGVGVIVNEVNTIPGFTKISMYPKLWEASGLSYTKLIDRLIELAIERHSREKSLQY